MIVPKSLVSTLTVTSYPHSRLRSFPPPLTDTLSSALIATQLALGGSGRAEPVFGRSLHPTTSGSLTFAPFDFNVIEGTFAGPIGDVNFMTSLLPEDKSRLAVRIHTSARSLSTSQTRRSMWEVRRNGFRGRFFAIAVGADFTPASHRRTREPSRSAGVTDRTEAANLRTMFVLASGQTIARLIHRAEPSLES